MSRPLRARAEARYDEIQRLVTRPVSLMEVCGTHTMAIGRAGLRARLPQGLRLLSGPGCPVCVTPVAVIDQLIAMAAEPGVCVATFGDLIRVPGSESSLAEARARGGDVRVVYSPADALQIARSEPRRVVIFPGVGFETTSPTVAAVVDRAARSGVENFTVLPAFRRVLPAMQALVSDPRSRIDGFLCPGHVSVVIGRAPYEPLARAGTPCVIAGFEPLDVLDGVVGLLRQRAEDRAQVEVQYRRAVPDEGNPTALALLERVLTPCDAHWRGIGSLPLSGHELRSEYQSLDARRRVPVAGGAGDGSAGGTGDGSAGGTGDGSAGGAGRDMPPGCACGEVLMGHIDPPGCPSFGRACTPSRPVGPCMVSSEGACAAWWRFERSEAGRSRG